MHGTTSAAKILGVSAQTIRRWTDEFADYLSGAALPDSGKNRRYTEDDLAVFALVNGMKDLGYTFEDIHASLAAGQRGQVELDKQIEQSSNKLELLQMELSRAKARIEELERAEIERDIYKDMLDDARTEIATLNRQIGELLNAKE